MSDRQRTAAEVEAARDWAALFDRVCEMPNDETKYALMRDGLKKLERQYAICVAVAARRILSPEAVSTIMRIAGAAEMHRMCGGEPVTLAQFVAMCAGGDPTDDLPWAECDRVYREMDVVGHSHAEFQDFIRSVLDNGN